MIKYILELENGLVFRGQGTTREDAKRDAHAGREVSSQGKARIKWEGTEEEKVARDLAECHLTR